MPEPWLDRSLALGVSNTGASGMVHLLDRGGAEMERRRRAKETALLAEERELHSISLLWQAPPGYPTSAWGSKSTRFSLSSRKRKF